MLNDMEYDESINVDIRSDSILTEDLLVDQNSLSNVFIPEQNDLPFSRGRQRRVKTSYKYAWRLLVLVSIFYGLPTFQYVLYQITDPAIRTEQCYFNHKCAYQVGNIVSFNNVISNVSYMFLSFVLYIIIIRHWDESLNIREYYLITCVILSMFFEGIFSSFYHLCPSRVNLQFDTTFMFFFGTLSIIYTLQKTRKNDLIDISKLFLFMGFLIFINTINLTLDTQNNSYEWIFVVIFFPIANFIISANVYFGHNNWSLNIFYFICRLRHSFTNLRRIPNISYLFCLIIINVVNICVLIACISKDIQFSMFLLGTLSLDMGIVIIHHIAYKIGEGVRMRLCELVLGLFTLIMIILSLYFYQLPTIKNSGSQSASAEYNRECVLFNFFDTHDLWHFCSSTWMFTGTLFIWGLN